MSRWPGLALLIAGLGGCSSRTILLGNSYPDAGGANAGSVPTVEVLPSPLDFGGVSIDGGSAQLFAIFQNAGTGTVRVTLPSPPLAPFDLPATGDLILPVGQPARNVSVTFRPTTTGPARGALGYQVCTVTPNDGGASECSPTRSISLQGSGL
jgi:hypothetical protein